jgi:predicted phage gp36 major capsid-like protein
MNKGLWDQICGELKRKLPMPLYEWSSMDAYSAVDAAATAVNHLLLIGDWTNYVIADRIGGTVEYIPHLFNTNANLPTGARGWFYHWRVGADSVNDAAFRLYTLTTAA